MNSKVTGFDNLKDSFDLRKIENLKKKQFKLQPKGSLLHKSSINSRSANLILKTNMIDHSGMTNPLIDTPRFQPNQEELLKKIIDLEKQLYEKERTTYNRISEMQKQINWLTTSIYTLIEANENATQIQKEKSQKIADEFNTPMSPPGLPPPKSLSFATDLKMMVTPEPSPDSNKGGFVLLDAELNMINDTSKRLNKRNVITPINECFTPDSCNSPYVNKPINMSR